MLCGVFDGRPRNGNADGPSSARGRVMTVHPQDDGTVLTADLQDDGTSGRVRTVHPKDDGSVLTADLQDDGMSGRCTRKMMAPS